MANYSSRKLQNISNNILRFIVYFVFAKCKRVIRKRENKTRLRHLELSLSRTGSLLVGYSIDYIMEHLGIR